MLKTAEYLLQFVLLFFVSLFPVEAGITLHILCLILLLKLHSCLPIIVPSPFTSQPTFLEQSWHLQQTTWIPLLQLFRTEGIRPSDKPTMLLCSFPKLFHTKDPQIDLCPCLLIAWESSDPNLRGLLFIQMWPNIKFHVCLSVRVEMAVRRLKCWVWIAVAVQAAIVLSITVERTSVKLKMPKLALLLAKHSRQSKDLWEPLKETVALLVTRVVTNTIVSVHLT